MRGEGRHCLLASVPPGDIDEFLKICFEKESGIDCILSLRKEDEEFYFDAGEDIILSQNIKLPIYISKTEDDDNFNLLPNQEIKLNPSEPYSLYLEKTEGPFYENYLIVFDSLMKIDDYKWFCNRKPIKEPDIEKRIEKYFSHFFKEERQEFKD